MTVTDLISTETISDITSQLWRSLAPEQDALEPGPLPGPRAAPTWIAARRPAGGCQASFVWMAEPVVVSLLDCAAASPS